MQATKPSSADRTAIAVSLARLAGDAFGSLATLPLYCTGQLPSPDPHVVIVDHFDVWRSCLIVICEVMKSDGFGLHEMPSALGRLMNEVTRIRDSYLQIHSDHASRPREALEAFGRLEVAYRQLMPLIRELGTELEFDTEFLPGGQSLKALTYERSLRSLGDRLAENAQSGHSISGSEPDA